MLYQLPNGKVVNISVEQYLDMTDQDIQDLMASNCGDYPESQWHDSVIKKPRKHQDKEFDKSIDYQEESDEIPMQVTTAIAIITVDDVGTTEDSEELPESEEED